MNTLTDVDHVVVIDGGSNNSGSQGNVQSTSTNNQNANKTLHVTVRSLFPYENACLQMLEKLNIVVLKGVTINKLLIAFEQGAADFN